MTRFRSLFLSSGDLTNTSLFLIGEAVVIAVLIAIGYGPLPLDHASLNCCGREQLLAGWPS